MRSGLLYIIKNHSTTFFMGGERGGRHAGGTGAKWFRHPA